MKKFYVESGLGIFDRFGWYAETAKEAFAIADSRKFIGEFVSIYYEDKEITFDELKKLAKTMGEIITLGSNATKRNDIIIGNVIVVHNIPDTPEKEAIKAIENAALSKYVHLDGTITQDLTNVPRHVIVDGHFFFLEDTKYIHRYDVDDISYADVLSVGYDEDENEEYILITHLMGDLTNIPF